MNAGIEIRELSTLEEFQRCVEIQKEVWGFDDPYDIVPLPLLMVSQRMGGVVLGAFQGDRMIGFVYSLPGTHHGRNAQWSHMLAVVPELRNSDIGYELKMAQYRMSQQLHADFIEWTFDPLESRNAYFNLSKLGCIVKEYEINIYGETSSPLHGGMPTDRLIAHWEIPPTSKTFPQWTTLPEAPALVTSSSAWKDDLRMIDSVRLDLNEPFLFVEIPVDNQKLRTESKDASLQWRLKTRDVFIHYLANGYVVYSFLRWQNSRSFYVLRNL